MGLLLAFALRFVLRWRGDYHLDDAQGNRRKAWRIAMGKRGWSERIIWDSRRARWVHASVLALPVTHPDHRDTPLWLVVCRSQGRSPWYLLTAEPITTAEDAWRVVFAYMRRWQIELAWTQSLRERILAGFKLHNEPTISPQNPQSHSPPLPARRVRARRHR